MDFINENLLFYLAAYLIGSIPFGLLLAKTFAGVNIKEHGSKSIGATNVLRVVNRWGDEVYITDSYGFGNNLFYGKTGGNIKTAKNKVLPKGTYFYFLDYYDGLNHKKQQGFININ